MAGLLSDRIGQTAAMVWMAMIYAPAMAYSELVVPFLLAGVGMGLVFPPAASTVLGAVRPEQAGQASGANNMIRELGGVFGIAVMTSVFTHAGGFASPQAFTDGLVAAVWVGAVVLAVGTVAALAVPPPAPRAGRPARRPGDRAGLSQAGAGSTTTSRGAGPGASIASRRRPSAATADRTRAARRADRPHREAPRRPGCPRRARWRPRTRR